MACKGCQCGNSEQENDELGCEFVVEGAGHMDGEAVDDGDGEMPLREGCIAEIVKMKGEKAGGEAAAELLQFMATAFLFHGVR